LCAGYDEPRGRGSYDEPCSGGVGSVAAAGGAHHPLMSRKERRAASAGQPCSQHRPSPAGSLLPGVRATRRVDLLVSALSCMSLLTCEWNTENVVPMWMQVIIHSLLREIQMTVKDRCAKTDSNLLRFILLQLISALRPGMVALHPMFTVSFPPSTQASDLMGAALVMLQVHLESINNSHGRYAVFPQTLV
jgi:hypothetical protein